MLHTDLLSCHNFPIFFAEFDALTGSKIASIDLGARVVRMAYSPTTSHVVIAILEVCLNTSLFFSFIFSEKLNFIYLYNCELPSVTNSKNKANAYDTVNRMSEK